MFSRSLTPPVKNWWQAGSRLEGRLKESWSDHKTANIIHQNTTEIDWPILNNIGRAFRVGKRRWMRELVGTFVGTAPFSGGSQESAKDASADTGKVYRVPPEGLEPSTL